MIASPRSYYFLFLIIVITSSSYLDTQSKATLNSNQFLVSPLGNYRLKLLNNCSLQIETFNSKNNKYQQQQILDLSNQGGKSCNNIKLDLNQKALLRSDRSIYQKFINPGQIRRMILQINDQGDINVFINPVEQLQNFYLKNVLRKSQNETRFIYDLQKNIKYTNKNGWNFQNNYGYITLSKQGQNIMKRVNLTKTNFNQSGFSDAEGQTRYSAVPGVQMKPRAENLNCNKIPQGVFAQFDQFWPIVRIYDRQKYLLAQYKIDNNIQNFCPQKTYLLGDKCVTNCPQFFYKQIRGKYGYCTLNCQSGSKINFNRVCTSTNYEDHTLHNNNIILNKNCPTQSTQYQFGCICSDNKFHDPNSNTCVQKCPEQYYGISGVCAKCPSRCGSCELDAKKVSYLSCKNCSNVYKGNLCVTPISKCQRISNCLKCNKNQKDQQICQKCEPFYTLSSDKFQCQLNCNQNQVLIMGSSGQGYCQNIQAGKNSNQFIGGNYKGKNYILRKQKTCPFGMKILRDKCVQSCPSGYQQNRDGRCICRSQLATFWNQTCVRISDIQKNQLGYYYNFTYNSFFNCPVGCISCQFNYCFQCAPNYILVVSSISSVCRQNSLYFSCNSQFYTYDSVGKICMSNKLIKFNTNITNCQTELRNRCIKCRDNYYLSQGTCKNSCQKDYFISKGRCIRKLDNCLISSLQSIPILSNVEESTIYSPLYKTYSQNQMQISNQPITEILSIRKELGIKTNQKLTTNIYHPEVLCKISATSSPNITPSNNQTIPPQVNPSSQCNKERQYLLMDGTCVQNCPFNTFPFVVQNENKTMCFKQTQCYNKDKSKPIQLQNGTCVSKCPQFSSLIFFGRGDMIMCQSLTECQKISKFTPFQLQNSQCSSACPLGTFPKLDQYQQLKCQNTNENVPKRINIDASVYPMPSILGEQKKNLYYFVVDEVLNPDDIVVSYYGYKNNPTPMVSNNLLSQSLQKDRIVDIATFNNKTFLAIKTVADQVVLDLTNNIKQFYSANGKRLSSSVYGVKTAQNRIHNTRSWLAIIAYVLSLLLICLHAIYIGNQLLYKVDNFLIFAQSLFFFSFIHLLINTSIGQFYYGFLWSHFGFFPNYFYPTIPPEYMEGYLNQQGYYLSNSYRLLTGDANFIRNAGFSFSLLCTFIFAFFIICIVILILKYVCRKYQIWYKRIAKNTLIAAFQFVSMNIFYWAVAHLLFNRNYLFTRYPNQPQIYTSFRSSCSAASIAWICIYGVYMILRFVFNPIGGLYMFKRLVFATILAASAYHFDAGTYKLFLIPLIAAQLIFMVLRFILQKPYLKRQKIFILVETILVIIAFITMYLWNDTGFVSIFVSIILFIFIFLLIQDLLDVYLDNNDQFYDDSVKLIPGLRYKQFQSGQPYEKINPHASSLPETDRRLKDG